MLFDSLVCKHVRGGVSASEREVWWVIYSILTWIHGCVPHISGQECCIGQLEFKLCYMKIFSHDVIILYYDWFVLFRHMYTVKYKIWSVDQPIVLKFWKCNRKIEMPWICATTKFFTRPFSSSPPGTRSVWAHVTMTYNQVPHLSVQRVWWLSVVSSMMQFQKCY